MLRPVLILLCSSLLLYLGSLVGREDLSYMSTLLEDLRMVLRRSLFTMALLHWRKRRLDLLLD